MAIPTEPIGSIPRPAWLVRAGRDLAAGRITVDAYARLAEDAVRETMGQFEATARR
jgi:5-methyltetrahydropteroyltriglutamate--homocysteine methyltransferase